MTRLALLLPALLALALYARAIGNGFVYDDLPVLVWRPMLHAVRTLPQALTSPWWSPEPYMYRPLALLSLGVDWVAGGGRAWVPHAMNVVLHAAVAVLVARLALRFLPAAGAMVAGLVFAAHPIHAEAISTAVGRAELLCALMLVGVALRATAERPPTLGARLGMMALAAAALASKEMGVVAPAVAFAAAWTQPAQRRHAWPWTLSATLGVLPLLVARVLVLGTFGGGPEHPAFAVGGWGTRTALALSMLPRTALALVVPGPAALDVAPTLTEVLAPNPLLVATGVVLVAAVVAAMVWHVRRPSAATLGVWIAAATIAPTSNLLFASGVVFGGRTLYAPSIGVALLAGVAVDAMLRRASPPRLLTGAAFAAWMVAASVFSVRDAGVWHDPDRLGATMLERQPTSYRAHVYAADLARQRGDAAGALPHYRAAMALFPRDQAQSYAGAVVALSQGDTTTALRWLDGSIALAPSHWQARTLRIKLALARNDRALALTLLDDGLRVTPEQRTWRAWRAALLPPSPAATP